MRGRDQLYRRHARIWLSGGALCVAALYCGGLLAAAHAAESLTPPPPPTAEVVAGPWVKIETFLRDPKNHSAPNITADSAPQETFTLPSLGHAEIFSSPRDLTPAATHSVNFSAMPAMFERRRAAPPAVTKPKATSVPAAVTPPIKPTPPATAANCVKPPAAQSKQDAALADDRATLNALRQAVQDLRLEKDLDFMMPQKAGVSQSTAAPPAIPAP